MKNLATCRPKEFMVQTLRIKKAAEKWLTATDIMGIRKNLPDIPEDIDPEKRREIVQEQGMKNLSAIFDAIFEKNPDATLDLLALACFVEPKDVDEHTMEEYMVALTEMMNNKAVNGFFTSLVRWGQTSTLTA